MEQQQVIMYQYDLFDSMGQDVIRPFAGSEAVSGAQPTKALQEKGAGEQERALTHDLREVKQLKETAVCESMHGGVRGRGSNPPTYSIISLLLIRS